MHSHSLESLELLLREGMRLDRQTSYKRRAPASASISPLTRARHGLADFVRDQPGNAKAWQLLSLAEECLLHYPAAVAALEKAIELGAKGNRELKRLAMLRAARNYWDTLPLSPEELADLARYLREHIGDGPYERNFRWTEEWLRARGVADAQEVIEEFRKRGGYSDMQVYYNVAR